MRVAMVGMGRMGTAVVREAERRGHAVVATIGHADNPDGAALDRLAGVDVVFEFTRPDAATANLERLLRSGHRVVTGTTGWTTELPRLSELVHRHGGALLHAANFSLGMHVARLAARELARLLAGLSGFDAAIRETHHRQKLDAPSGTALALQADLRAADPSREYPIASERVGHVPGTHTLLVDGEHETITLTHTARNRAVFAAGAVVAGEWLAGRHGVFTFDHVITGGSS
jgi:4-hydroxy-tetrahydrodipicolinate reductase